MAAGGGDLGLPMSIKVYISPRMEAREALVALNMIEGVGPIRLRQLLESFGDPAAILRASKLQLASVRGIGEDTAEAADGMDSTTEPDQPLDIKAEAAWWLGRLDDCIEAREAAFAIFDECGQPRPAAQCAVCREVQHAPPRFVILSSTCPIVSHFAHRFLVGASQIIISGRERDRG